MGAQGHTCPHRYNGPYAWNRVGAARLKNVSEIWILCKPAIDVIINFWRAYATGWEWWRVPRLSASRILVKLIMAKDSVSNESSEHSKFIADNHPDDTSHNGRSYRIRLHSRLVSESNTPMHERIYLRHGIGDVSLGSWLPFPRLS